MKIAAKTGTEAAAADNIEKYNLSFKAAVNKLKDKGIYGKAVIVQFHHKALAQALGLKYLLRQDRVRLKQEIL